MAFNLGDSKPKNSGRKQGTPNKRNQEIYELAKEHGADPALFLIKVMKGDRRDFGYEDAKTVHKRNYDREKASYDKTQSEHKSKGKGLKPFPEYEELTESEYETMNLFSSDMRMDAAKELMPYLYGKRKPVDSDGNDNDGDPITRLANALRNKE